jgi:acetyltransferase-like isoleucine patch superfamily enzyme
VGANSTVLAGVTLGEGTSVGAMSLVNKGTPAGAFVGGVPIRLLSNSDR